MSAPATESAPAAATAGAARPASSKPPMGAAARAKAKAKAKARAKTAAIKTAKHRQQAAEAEERREKQPHAGPDDADSEQDALEQDEDDEERTFPYCLEEDYREWSGEQRAEVLSAIVTELRRHCAREGTSPGDETSLFVPTGPSGVRYGTDEKSWFAGANSVTAFFLDSFLYSHADMQAMIDRGALDIFWCRRCERVVPGDCRRKTDSERAAEESARRNEIDAMRRRHRAEANERRRRRAHAPPLPADANAAESLVAAAATPAAAPSSFVHSAVSSLANAFSFLSTAEDDEIALESSDHEADGEALDDHAEQAAAAAADAALAAAIAALPAISPYRFPRNNAAPKMCRLCHAPGGQVSVRTHLTHSLSVAQMTDMYRALIVPNIDWAQPIGSASRKYKAASAGSVTIDDAVYALDIGSRLGNQLYMGKLYTACPRWVGVELDSFFVAQSRRILRRWRMHSHVRVVEGDIALHSDLLRAAKLVFFFNSFELHVTRERHRELLQFLADSIAQTNQYLLSCPSLEEIYTRAESDVNLEAWVELVASKDDSFLYRVR